MLQELKVLFQEMADHTLLECKQCFRPYSCCSPEYCEMAIEYAKQEFNIDLQKTGHDRLPLMGNNGCIAEPYLRPLCTLHTCSINSIGFGKLGQQWTDKYFELREKIEDEY